MVRGIIEALVGAVPAAGFQHVPVHDRDDGLVREAFLDPAEVRAVDPAHEEAPGLQEAAHVVQGRPQRAEPVVAPGHLHRLLPVDRLALPPEDEQFALEIAQVAVAVRRHAAGRDEAVVLVEPVLLVIEAHLRDGVLLQLGVDGDRGEDRDRLLG